MRGSLNFCSRFFSFVALALATFFLRPHTLTLAVYRTLNLVPHERNFLIDTRSDTLDTCGLSERHTRAMLREMSVCGRRKKVARARATKEKNRLQKLRDPRMALLEA